MNAEEFIFNNPSSIDGMAVHQLVTSCPPLDTNSTYCNLLQTSHFDETSITANLNDGQLVGFVSGYILPNSIDTLFIWQVAVSEKVRGKGVAKKMLSLLLKRARCSGVRFIETSITESNLGSWALFRSLAGQLGSTLEETVMFDKQEHFKGKHDTEHLVRIGPISF
ncbi:MAG: diaminobutyrate acetyltransferase [Marinomonas colpomeniae]